MGPKSDPERSPRLSLGSQKHSQGSRGRWLRAGGPRSAVALAPGSSGGRAGCRPRGLCFAGPRHPCTGCPSTCVPTAVTGALHPGPLCLHPAFGTPRGQDGVLGPRRFCGEAHRPRWGSPGGRGSPRRAQAGAQRLRLPSCAHRPRQGALVTPGHRRPGWADLCWGPTPASLCCREPGGSWVPISGAGAPPVCFASPGAGQGGDGPPAV